MGAGEAIGLSYCREDEGILAAKGAKGQNRSDTTPALLYAKLTTRLFLKVNLHPPSERRGSVSIPPHTQSRQINILFGRGRGRGNLYDDGRRRDVSSTRAPQTRRNNSGFGCAEMAMSRLRESRGCIRLLFVCEKLHA